MAAESSFSERQAMEVEREVVDLYRAFFLRDRIGDVFDGTISGVAGFGVFVVIDDPFVEGLVRLEALSDDYYVYDEPACRLVGRRSGRTFALGDTVKVEVQSVSVIRRKVDFALHEHRAAERTEVYGRGDDGAGRGRHRRGESDRHRGKAERPHFPVDKSTRGGASAAGGKGKPRGKSKPSGKPSKGPSKRKGKPRR
jgi:ribonuclease R